MSSSLDLFLGKPALCDSDQVRQFLKGYQRRWAQRGFLPRKPITADMLLGLLQSLKDQTEPIGSQEVAFSYLLGFWGLLRAAEVFHLQWNDIDVYDDVVNIRVRKSKTDPLQKGQVVVLTRTHLPAQFILWLRNKEAREGPLFVVSTSDVA